MDIANFSGLIAWIAQHPEWAYAVIFLAAFTESLAVVGLFVPGALIMFGVGAIAAVGSLDLWATLAWAAAGAIAGDASSYWLGRHYRAELHNRWPFSRYPKLLAKGTAFFHRHGGMSIFLGRFVGPVEKMLRTPRTPIWVGTVAVERISRSLAWFNLPQDGQDFNVPRRVLLESLVGLPARLAGRGGASVSAGEEPVWDKGVLLSYQPE